MSSSLLVGAGQLIIDDGLLIIECCFCTGTSLISGLFFQLKIRAHHRRESHCQVLHIIRDMPCTIIVAETLT